MKKKIKKFVEVQQIEGNNKSYLALLGIRLVESRQRTKRNKFKLLCRKKNRLGYRFDHTQKYCKAHKPWVGP